MTFNKKKRNLIIIGIFLLLFCVSIGSAYLKERLRVNGTTNIEKNSWVIYFDKAIEKEGSVEATKELKIDDTKTTIDFGIILNKPGDFYEFDVNVVNDGSVDAMIDTIVQEGIEDKKKSISPIQRPIAMELKSNIVTY